MHTELETFLATHDVVATESASWRGGQMQLTINLYMTTDPPPDNLVTSARALIVTDDQVLVMTNPAGEHILPGGRREDGEPPLVTLQREVLEETGLAIPDGPQLAVLHYHHETPKPAIYPYPYPDFLNLVYLIQLPAVTEVVVSDTYELEGAFVPVAELTADRLPPTQLHLLGRISQTKQTRQPLAR